MKYGFQIVLLFVLSFTLASVQAADDKGKGKLTCLVLSDYNNPNFKTSMQELSYKAGFIDNYYSRNDISAVIEMCKGNYKKINNAINYGLVRKKDMVAVSKILGIDDFKAKPRTPKGITFERIRNKLYVSGFSSAGSSNIASAFVNRPNSYCGSLAHKAIDGDRKAQEKLGYGDGAVSMSFTPFFCSYQMINGYSDGNRLDHFCHEVSQFTRYIANRYVAGDSITSMLSLVDKIDCSKAAQTYQGCQLEEQYRKAALSIIVTFDRESMKRRGGRVVNEVSQRCVSVETDYQLSH